MTSGRTVLLREDFQNNNNHWLVISDQFHVLDVKDGHYSLISSSTNGYISAIAIPGLENVNFKIETTIRKISGVNNFFYGLIWGMKDEANLYSLGLTGDGRTAVTRKNNGEFYDYIDNRQIKAAVRAGNGAENALRVVREGDRIKFSVNDYVIHEMDFPKPFGDKVGFVFYNKMELAVDNLIVSIE